MNNYLVGKQTRYIKQQLAEKNKWLMKWCSLSGINITLSNKRSYFTYQSGTNLEA